MTIPRNTMLLLAASSMLLLSISVQAKTTQPNIIIIWGDDVGQSDVSA
ncbi:MAG: hypothetical protein AB7I18_11500 [Candidatus Berkiella sp.]